MKLPDHIIDRAEALSIADQCLVHRYLYYILCRPMLTDREYDMLERDASNRDDTPIDHPIHKPGSDLASSYPQEIADLALQIHHPELH